MTESTTLDAAQRIADEVLLPAAIDVDRSGTVPASHFDLLASAGLYGLASPPDVNQLDLRGFPDVCRVVEILASGCLTTAFVWAQHHSAVMAAANSQTPGLRGTWLEPLATGTRRAGLAIAAAVRPGPAVLRATAVDGGYVLDGEAPWVSGWGLVDTLYVAARDADDVIVWALIDAQESARLAAEPLDMVSLQASRTVHLRFDGFVVPADRVTGLMPHAEWTARDPATLRFNGSLALGVAARAVALLGTGALEKELAECRSALDTADPSTMQAARAAASELALRASAAYAVHTGSRSVLTDHQAQRLIREATFLLVFGSRPGIRAALLDTLA